MSDQHVAGGEHYLECHEQGEKVPGEKSEHHTGGQGLIDGVKGREGLIVVALAHCKGQDP